MGNETRTTAVIFAGGDAPEPGTLDELTSDALLVAADSGLAHAHAAGLAVDVVVGDLDSVDPADLDAAIAAGAIIERHPSDKDVTDLELAIETARSRGARRVVVVGAGGGRLDHFLANALLLASPGFADLELEARIGAASAVVVRHTVESELHGHPGDLLTLLPLGGPARGVRTRGLRWALHGEDLLPGSSRGVSNEFEASTAGVALDDGVLLAVRPGPAPAGGTPPKPTTTPTTRRTS
jgi:thiamine pyrophosphokinase